MNPYDAFMSPADRAACRCAEAEAVPTAAMPDTGAACTEMPSLAMVYAKLQRFDGVYEPGEALARGTLFSALDKPFTAGGRK